MIWIVCFVVEKLLSSLGGEVKSFLLTVHRLNPKADNHITTHLIVINDR